MIMRAALLLGILIAGGPSILRNLPAGEEPPVTIRGVSVYGLDREDEPPIIYRDSVDREGKPVRVRGFITIQFDVAAQHPPPLKIRFAHCDRDWRPDANMFVQDEYHNTTFTLDYRAAPGGVRNYAYRYVNRFPDENDVIRFTYSGNWIFQIVDQEERTVYAEGRFFVVDQLYPLRMQIQDDYLTANASPLNQIHRVDVRLAAFDEMEAPFVTTVDIYQNRRFHTPFRIDVNDRDPYTTVEGLGQGFRLFRISSIYPGNEYRTLDLSNVTRYPHWTLVRPVEGADQPRMFWRTGADRNGTAALNRFTGLASDYLEVAFRLNLTETDRRQMLSGGRDLFVVGPFNQWNPGIGDRLAYDASENVMAVREWLRRGIYDYQYIIGIWDEAAGQVRAQDWVIVEGNDWRTTNVYTSVVYYRDPRYGGFDRIVGMMRGKSVPSTQ